MITLLDNGRHHRVFLRVSDLLALVVSDTHNECWLSGSGNVLESPWFPISAAVRVGPVGYGTSQTLIPVGLPL